MILIAPALVFGLATVISPGVMAVLTQIGGAVTSVGRQQSIRISNYFRISNSSNGDTLSSMVLTSLLGLTGIPMAIGALTCTGSSFVNYVLFSRLNIGGSKSKAFAVFVEPLTQIDLIAKFYNYMVRTQLSVL